MAIKPLPALIFGRDFRERVINFDALVEEGTISPDDVQPLLLRGNGRRGLGGDQEGVRHFLRFFKNMIVSAASRFSR